MAMGPAKLYHMNTESINFIATRSFITYMRDLNYDNISTNDYKVPDNYLLKSAVKNWNRAVRGVKSPVEQNCLQELVLQLFDPSRPHYKPWKNLRGNKALPNWILASRHGLSLTLAYLCFEGLDSIVRSGLQIRPGQPNRFSDSIYEVWDIDDKMSEGTWKYNNALNDVLESMFGDSENFGFKYHDEKSFIEWMHDPHQRAGQNALTIMNIAVMLRQKITLRHLLTERTNPNQTSATGFSVLIAAISHCRSDEDFESSQWFEDGLQIIGILLAHGADLGKKDVTIKPLQAAVICFPWNPTIYLKIIILPLNHGADPNGVADDDVNVLRIRHHESNPLCQMFGKFNNSECGEPPAGSVANASKPVNNKAQMLELAIQVRGTSTFYDTPLRLLGHNSHPSPARGQLKELLKSHGAKSLHLFPVKDLPGYCEVDIAALCGKEVVLRFRH